jgi:hypothetical protein
VVIENNGDLDRLKQQAKDFADQVLGERGSGGEKGTEEE